MRAYRQRRSTLGTLLLMAAVAAPALGEGVRVTVVPAAASVPLGGDRRLTAYVNGSASTAVVWSVNGIAGGSSLVGTIRRRGQVHGAPRGGNIYGNFPLMTNYVNFNASRDDYADTRGVMLPALSLSQYGATLARWFGAGDADLDGVFPTLANFTTRDLGLLL